MTRKKTVKQLMAIGIQRNEAAAFARTYRKIKAAKKEDMFPEIVSPVQPKICAVRNYRIVPYKAACVMSEAVKELCVSEPEYSIKQRLCDRLTAALMRNGAIEFTMRALPDGSTEFRADLNVALRY